MKKILHILIAIIPSLSATSQNLVQNPSFEDTVACPNGYAQITNSVGWSSFRETCDYFNSCGTSGFSAPSNFAGYQVPHSGSAYSGIITFAKPALYREIIGSQLSSPLIIGQKYYVSFYTSLAISQPNICYATNKIGATFTTIPYDAFTNQIPIYNTAQLYYDTIITDTTNWTLIAGSFISDSAYNYIAIGNFFNDVNTDTACIQNVSNKLWAYYYIDDIYVSTDSASVEAVNEFANANNIILGEACPNPNDGKAEIDYYLPVSVSNAEMIFSDLLGRVINKTKLVSGYGTVAVDTQGLPNGNYIYSLVADGKVIDTKKMICTK